MTRHWDLGNPAYPYKKGLVDLGGSLAWLQPDGGWGWSNAGLIVEGEESLLVDTLFDMSLTQDMLSAMRDAAPKAAAEIPIIINTHANGDHCNGNGCCPRAEIISSKASAEEMDHENPEMMVALLDQADQMGGLGEYFKFCFGKFDFAGVERRLPTRTFSDQLDLKVGDKDVRLIEVGPAHTRGDILVHVPADKTIFTGDILFIEGTPIIWRGPIGNWIKALDMMLDMELETIVPGHGPITDKRGVQAVRDYFVYINEEARKRFDAGMTDAFEAAQDIALGDYDSWGDAERIAINVNTLYAEFKGEEPPAAPELFGQMAAIWKARRS